MIRVSAGSLVIFLVFAAFALFFPWRNGSAGPGQLTLTRYYHRPISWAREFYLGGSLEERTSLFVQDDPESSERIWNDTVFELFLDSRWSGVVRTYGKMELTAYHPQSERRIRVIPEQAYLDLYLGPIDIRAGFQIFAWGVAELYNPTDRLNPLDFTDILEAEKEGSLALKIITSFSNWSFEAIWIPLPEDSLLPSSSGRFFLPTRIVTALGPNINVTSFSLKPRRSLKNPQFAGRVRGIVGRFDLAFSYFYGFVTVPNVEVVAGPLDPITNAVPVTVTQVFPREHVIGVNLATTIDRLALHLESAVTIPKETGRDIGSADELRWNYVIGGQYTFDDLLGDDDLEFFLDFTQELHAGRQAFNLTRPFQLSLLTRVRYIFSEELALSVEGAIDFNDKAYVIRPKMIWEFYEGFHLSAGVDIINGPDGSFFNQFDEDERAYLWLKYQF